MDTTATKNPLGYEKIPVLLKRFAAPSIVAMLVSSLYNIVDQIFIGQGLGYLGNGATESILPYAQDYARITAVGMPFLIFTNAACNLIRADGSPKYSMICMVTGALVNTGLDPLFIFKFHMGIAGDNICE